MKRFFIACLVVFLLVGYAVIAIGSDDSDTTDSSSNSESSASSESSTGSNSNSGKLSEEEANNKESALAEAQKISSGYSRAALILSLTNKGYTEGAATYAADNCGADWNANAVERAKRYLQVSTYSANTLARQLRFEKYTDQEAEYGANHCGADWNDQAAKAASNYTKKHKDWTAYDVMQYLISQGYTSSQIEYGMRANGMVRD